MAKPAAYRLDDQTLHYIDALAGALSVSKTEIVRRGVSTLVGIALAQSDQIEGIIAELRETYGDDARLVVSPVLDADGNLGDLIVEIDGKVVENVQATAILPPKSNHARVYIDVRPRGSVEEEKAALERVLDAAATHGLVPLPCIETSAPWPSRDPLVLRIRIGDLAAEASTGAKLEPVEA